ncbi:MAG: FHA domain-containing protein [Desulfobacteraceae bacterium]|jgi:hypothetical protein
MTRLYILSGPNVGQSFEIEGDAFYIGRSPYNDVQIEDKFVSRKHIKILRKGNKYLVEDLQSKNGTYLNGEQISPGILTELQEGLPVSIGMSVICLGEGCTEELSALLDALNLSEFAILDSEERSADRPMTAKKNMELIYEVSDTLSQALDVDEILERILHRIFDLLKRIDRGIIFLTDSETGELKKVVSRSKDDVDDSTRPYSQEVVDRVVQHKRAIMVSDSDAEVEDDLPETLKLLKIKSVMCVPMISRSKVRGVIYVDSVTKPYGFREEDLRLLNALSSPVAMAIENAELALGKSANS